MTQTELAQQLYVTESAVSKWERGISYPDITLVAAICSALDISEHELITASDDMHQRQVELQAQKYRHLRSVYLWTWNGIYGATILTCLICNLAITHTLTWFFIAVTACMTGYSLTNLPLLVTKRKGIITLGSFFFSLNLLLLTCCLYTNGHWFFVSFTSLLLGFSVIFAPIVLRSLVLPKNWGKHKGLLSMGADTLLLFLLLTAVSVYQNQLNTLLYPNGVLSLYLLALPWAYLIVIRYGKINVWFRTSICLMISGFYVLTINSVSDAITDQKPFAFQPTNFADWSNYYINGNVSTVIMIVCAAVALLFVFVGILRLDREKTGKTKGIAEREDD